MFGDLDKIDILAETKTGEVVMVLVCNGFIDGSPETQKALLDKGHTQNHGPAAILLLKFLTLGVVQIALHLVEQGLLRFRGAVNKAVADQNHHHFSCFGFCQNVDLIQVAKHIFNGHYLHQSLFDSIFL